MHSRFPWAFMSIDTNWLARARACVCLSACVNRKRVWALQHTLYGHISAVSVWLLLCPLSTWALFGTMAADSKMQWCMILYSARPCLVALLNAKIHVWKRMCLFQGLERPLQPQPWPAGVDSQQWQPPDPLQYGVHLLGTIRTLGRWWRAQRGGGQPPGGQVRAALVRKRNSTSYLI